LSGLPDNFQVVKKVDSQKPTALLGPTAQIYPRPIRRNGEACTGIAPGNGGCRQSISNCSKDYFLRLQWTVGFLCARFDGLVRQ